MLGPGNTASRLLLQAALITTLFFGTSAYAADAVYHLRKGPGAAFPVVYDISSSSDLSLQSVQGSWVRVSDGTREGWLPASVLQPGKGRSAAQVWFINEASEPGLWSLSLGLSTDDSYEFNLAYAMANEVALDGRMRRASSGLAEWQTYEIGASFPLQRFSRLHWLGYAGVGVGSANEYSDRWQEAGESTSVTTLSVSTDFVWQLAQRFDLRLRLRAEQAFGGDDKVSTATSLIWNLAI